MINARIDVFLGPFLAGDVPAPRRPLVPEAVERGNAYLEAGVDLGVARISWGLLLYGEAMARVADQLAALRRQSSA